MRRAIFAGLMLASVSAWASLSTSVLNITDHAAEEGPLAESAFGISIIVDDTCKLPVTQVPCAPNNSALGSISDAANSSVAQTIVYPGTPLTSTGVPNAHVPYGLINYSFSGYNLGLDSTYYSAATANSVLLNQPFCTSGQAQAFPPVAFSTALVNTAGSTGLCAYAYGVEFSITSGYLGLDTATASGTSASMTALFAAMASAHSSWTWADIKGALRQTASNWAGGYVAYNSTGPAFGYGNVNYSSAVGISSATSIYLEPPGMGIANHSSYIVVTLYPYMQTRRAKEVIYAGGTWPAASSGNELTAAQIASAGGTKVYDDFGATGIQTFTYSPASSGSDTFTVLTLDASGNGSRIESFAQSTQSFVVGIACFDD